MPNFTPADVTVITVSSNSSAILPNMLESLPNGCKTIIVDNASTDIVTLRPLAERHTAGLIELSDNIGFGQACNAGARAATTEFIFFLNPDARLEDDAISALLHAATRYPDGTAFSPKIANANGTAFFKRRSVLLPKSQWLAKGWPANEVALPVLGGSAIFVRRADFAPFDPNIFMYHEDDDWSINHSKNGHALIFVPDARVVHEAGMSSGRSPGIANFKAYHLGRSRVYAMGKHGVPFARLGSVMAAGFGMLSPLVVLSKRKRAKAVGYWRGVISALGARIT